MKKVNRKPYIILGISALVLVIGGGAAATFAAFVANVPVDQQIGYLGLRKKTMFLDTFDGNESHWTNGYYNWDCGLSANTHAIYYMYAFDSSHSGTVFEWLQGTIVASPSSGNLKDHYLIAFQFDTTIYNSFNFVRFNPQGTAVPSWVRTDDPQSLWDQTSSQTYNSSVNYYSINTDDRSGNDGYGHNTAGIKQTGWVTVTNGILSVAFS